MSAKEARNAISDEDSGFSYLPFSQIKQRANIEEFGDPLNQVRAAAEGALRTVSLGTSDIAFERMGVPYREIEGRASLDAGTAGEVAGYLIPSPIKKLPGMNLLTSPLRITEKAGEFTGKIAGEAIKKVVGGKTKDTLARKMIQTGTSLGVRGGTEGGIIEGSHAITEQIAKKEQLNAEAAIVRAKHGVKFGAAFGSVLGTSSEVVIKAAKAIDQKVIKSLAKAAGEKTVPLDLTLSKNIKTTEKTLGDLPHLKLNRKAGEDFYTFKKNQNRIQISDNLEGKKVLDLNDPEHVIQLGEDLNFLDLPDFKHVFNPKLGPSVSILKAYRQGAGKTPITSLSRVKLGKLVAKDKALRADLDLIVKTAKEKGISPSLAASRKSLISKINRNKVTITGLKSKITTAEKFRVTKKTIAKELKKYDAIKMGDDLYILNPGKFDDIKTNSFLTSKPGEKVKRSPEYALRAIGARTGEFKKLAKKGDKRINEVGDFVLDSYLETAGGNKLMGLKTSTDDLMETVQRRRSESIAKMDESVAELTNELERQGLGIGIKSSEVSSFIKSHLLTELTNPKTGAVKPQYSTLYNQLDDAAKEYNRYSRHLEDGIEEALTPAEFRELRMSLDQITNFSKDDLGMNFFRKRIRTFMEDSLVQRMEQVDGTGELVNFYKEGKKQYGLAADAMEIIEKSLIKDMSNNKIGLTSYGSGGIGAMIGGAVGGFPGAVAGTAVGTAAREFGRKRGDLFIALYGDKLFKSANGIERRIRKSVGGFMKAPSAGMILPVVRMDSEKLQDNYRKDFSNFKYDPEKMMNDFYEENKGLTETLPDHSNAIAQTIQRGDEFLKDKLPKNPYSSNYFKAYTPSEMELRKFERYKNAVQKPLSVIDDLNSGTISNEGIESLRIVYPGIFDEIKNEFIKQMEKIKPDYRKRIQLDKMFGIKGDFYLEKQNIQYLQQSSRVAQEREEEKKRLAGGKINIDNRSMTDAQAIGQA